jgi:hypothetical protein
VQKFAHQLLATLRVLENAQVKHGQSELKILVSVVRFRPRPPDLTPQFARIAAFFFGRSLSAACWAVTATLLPLALAL